MKRIKEVRQHERYSTDYIDSQAYLGFPKRTSRGMMSSDVVVTISWERDWLSPAVNDEIPVFMTPLVAALLVLRKEGANADVEYEHDKTNRADSVACDIFIFFLFKGMLWL